MEGVLLVTAAMENEEEGRKEGGEEEGGREWNRKQSLGIAMAFPATGITHLPTHPLWPDPTR